MSTLAFLLQPELMPFASALGIVVGLCLLEIAMLFTGFSLLGQGDAGVEADLDADVDVDIGLDAPADVSVGLDAPADVSVGLDAPADVSVGLNAPADVSVGLNAPDDVDLDVGLDAAPDVDADLSAAANGSAADGTIAAAGLLSWFGIGQVPLMIWIAGTLSAFGLAGFLLQVATAGIIGQPMPALLAAAIAVVPGLGAGGALARMIGRLMPKLETTAISRRSYGGRRGVITTGTARRGTPAEARFQDGHGNTHYAMVEPMHDAERLPAGTEIAIMRLRTGALRAIRLDDAPEGRAG
ncbi:MAG: OB-fold-containig protein [Pseudomonadota bacterium]